MSFKGEVTWDTDNTCTLRPVGKMNCSIKAFMNRALYDASEENLWRQAATAAGMDGVKAMYLMPDTHYGFGIPIGGVVVTDDIMIQGGSGYDISCGMLLMKIEGLHADAIVDPAVRRAWINAIEERVPTGVGSHRPPKMKEVRFEDIMGVLLHGVHGTPVDKGRCERPFLRVDEKHFDPKRIPKAFEKMAPQFGSLGGGNHFIEMQVDPKDSTVWVVIHTGSRGYGWQTANYYFYEGARLRGLPSNKREMSWLRWDEPLGKEFWAHHNSAANYAIGNRHMIAAQVTGAIQEVLGVDTRLHYEISHNLIQEESWGEDGKIAHGFVHRKGATRAFPAGHLDLWRTQWADTGHPIITPGSMLHGAALMMPLPGAVDSGFSVNHGAGRLLGRGQAKREFKDDQRAIDGEMNAHLVKCDDGTVVKGIMINGRKTPLDECGRVYKDLDTVLNVLEESKVAKVVRRLYPVANIKGLD